MSEDLERLHRCMQSLSDSELYILITNYYKQFQASKPGYYVPTRESFYHLFSDRCEMEMVYGPDVADKIFWNLTKGLPAVRVYEIRKLWEGCNAFLN